MEIKYGWIANELSSDDIIEVPGVGDRAPRSIQRYTLVEVMSLRYQEIFNFINEKISQSGFEEKIPAGLVLTGGSSKAEGIVELAEEVFHKQVRVGIPQSLHGGSEDVVKNPEYAASVGLLLYAQKQNNHLLEAVNEDFMNIAKKLFQRLFYN